MRWSNGGFSRWLLLLVLLCAGPSLCFPQANGQTPPSPLPTKSISQLKDNLTQALALCTTLQANLQMRIVAFQSLLDSYNALAQMQQQLQKQVDSLQQNLNDSDKQLLTAQADLQATKDLSDKLQTSLNEASSLLASYKGETDKAVRSVVLQRDAWMYGAIVAIVAAVGLGVYAAVK